MLRTKVNKPLASTKHVLKSPTKYLVYVLPECGPAQAISVRAFSRIVWLELHARFLLVPLDEARRCRKACRASPVQAP